MAATKWVIKYSYLILADLRSYIAGVPGSGCVCFHSSSPSTLQVPLDLHTMSAAASPPPLPHHLVPSLGVVVAAVHLQLLLWVHVLHQPLTGSAHLNRLEVYLVWLMVCFVMPIVEYI